MGSNSPHIYVLCGLEEIVSIFWREWGWGLGEMDIYGIYLDSTCGWQESACKCEPLRNPRQRIESTTGSKFSRIEVGVRGGAPGWCLIWLPYKLGRFLGACVYVIYE